MSEQAQAPKFKQGIRAEQEVRRYVPPSARPPDPWHPMAEAPLDGSYCYLKDDPAHEEWYWYRTRVFKRGVWDNTGWWRRRFGIKYPAEFKPSGWRRVSEGLPPQ